MLNSPSKKDMEQFIDKCVVRLAPMAVLAAIEYVAVFAAVMADLASGLRRSRHEGRATTSRGFRNTVDKTARYYTALIAIIDTIIIAALTYLNVAHGIDIPSLPLFTTIGALGLAGIEAKSICENTGRDRHAKDLADKVRRLASDPEIRNLLSKLLHRL